MNKKQKHEAVMKVLQEYNLDSSSLWDCHGTPVILHKAIESIAAQAGIKFDPPQVIEANSKDRIAVICVTGRMKDVTAWSFGEAAPNNNKNSYPYAMAEKRAKDRVVLKLIGLAGEVYSEDEADDFKASRPSNQNTSAPQPKKDSRETYERLSAALHKHEDLSDLHAWEEHPAVISARKSLPADWAKSLTQEITAHENRLMDKAAAA